MDRGHDDLPSRDLVDDILVESLGDSDLAIRSTLRRLPAYLDSAGDRSVVEGVGFPLGTAGHIHVHRIIHLVATDCTECMEWAVLALVWGERDALKLASLNLFSGSSALR
jgi:hypothetical protein